MTDYAYIVDSFGFNIEEFELSGKKGYRIKATVLKPSAYYHCGYANVADAQLVMERLVDRFDMQTYRVNFAPDNPFRIRDNLDK